MAWRPTVLSLANPTDGKMQIENIGDRSLSSYSVSGKMILMEKLTDPDISGLTNGIFFISITDHDGIIVLRSKIVKY
jgi:hypothetical protein